jgi:(4S)-4-hydroxy-5-phosphonooxypentane-2,3-dione isomerase
MLALYVSLHVRPETRDAFVAGIKAQAEASLEYELGCVRFDVCEDVEDADHFLLYEVYEDEAAFKAHRETEHFARWAEARGAYVVEQDRTLTRIL